MLYYTFETNSASFLILEVVYQDVCFVQSSSKLRTAQRRNALNFLLLPTSGYLYYNSKIVSYFFSVD